MPNSIGANGITVASQAELIEDWTTNFETIYGADVDLSPSSPDGQLMNLIIQTILDLEDLVVQVYNTFDPDNAMGVILDQRVAINGIQRQGGTYTIQPIEITMIQTGTLYGLDQDVEDVYTVADGSGNQYELITTTPITATGTYNLLFQAANPGAVSSALNSITVPVSIVLGVSSINNTAGPQTVGENEETDAALKVRRQQSVSLASQGYRAGLKAALANITGITFAEVYENKTSTVNSDGMPAHSIWVIIAGAQSISAPAYSSLSSYSYGDLVSSSGTVYTSIQNNNINNPVTNAAYWAQYNAVADAIFRKRNAGCDMFGGESYIYNEEDGQQTVINWDLVVEEPLFIQFTASSIDGHNLPNYAAILGLTSAPGLPTLLAPGVFQSVNINEVATLVQSIDPNCLVTNAGLCATVGGTYISLLPPSSKKNQFQISSVNIIILPILITPASVTVAPSGTQTFSAIGGHGTYNWTMQSNPSGGSIDPSTGLYTAGATGNVTDVVLVTDGLGNIATASVTVS